MGVSALPIEKLQKIQNRHMDKLVLYGAYPCSNTDLNKDLHKYYTKYSVDDKWLRLKQKNLNVFIDSLVATM